jgi:hypothetical protein
MTWITEELIKNLSVGDKLQCINDDFPNDDFPYLTGGLGEEKYLLKKINFTR